MDYQTSITPLNNFGSQLLRLCVHLPVDNKIIIYSHMIVIHPPKFNFSMLSGQVRNEHDTVIDISSLGSTFVLNRFNGSS